MSATRPTVVISHALAGAERTETVTLSMADFTRFDIIRARRGFPARDEAESLFMSIVGYCALIREGKIPAETKLDDFLDTVLMIEEAGDKETDDKETEEPFRTNGGDPDDVRPGLTVGNTSIDAAF